MREVNNSEDILDSRDVIARRDELKEEREALTPACLSSMWCLCAAHALGAPTEDKCNTDENYRCPDDMEGRANVNTLSEWDEENSKELAALEAFISEGSSSWEDGETLVRESYFEDYARDLAEDIGAIPKDATWPLTCIDWEQAARELQYDYTGADFDGVTYYYRS